MHRQLLPTAIIARTLYTQRRAFLAHKQTASAWRHNKSKLLRRRREGANEEKKCCPFIDSLLYTARSRLHCEISSDCVVGTLGNQSFEHLSSRWVCFRRDGSMSRAQKNPEVRRLKIFDGLTFVIQLVNTWQRRVFWWQHSSLLNTNNKTLTSYSVIYHFTQTISFSQQFYTLDSTSTTRITQSVHHIHTA